MRRSMPLVGAVVVAAVVLVAGASGASNPASRPARWVITDLGTLGGCCGQAVAINERGQIIGEADTRANDEEGDPISHAFLWQNGKLRDLGTLGGRNRNAEAVAINDRGQVLAYSWHTVKDPADKEKFDADYPRGFLWRNGTATALGRVGRQPYSLPFALDNHGRAVGCSYTTSGMVHDYINWSAFLWQNGRMTGLGTLPHPYESFACATAINERGQIVGDSIWRAFLWQNGKMHDLGTLGAGPSQASAINDRGQIVGWSDTRPRTRMAIRSVTRRCGRSDTAPDHPWARFWAPTCARGAQKLVLSREVELPGVPARAEFDLRPFSRTVIGSVQLLVNGHIVLDLSAKALGVRDMGEYELGPAELRHFRLGENELRVVATKRALPVSAPACNTGSPESVVGLLFGLRGQSIADLSVSAGKAPIQYVRGSLYQLNGTFTVRNTGPSAAMPAPSSSRYRPRNCRRPSTH